MNPTTANTWEDLMAVALVGTGKRTIDKPIVDLTFDAAIDAQASAKLLAGAAAVSLQTRAGLVPQTSPVPAAGPAPADKTSACSPAAAQILELLLGDNVSVLARAQLVTHWLERCALAQQRVPHATLVGLLKAATTDQSLREAALPTLGDRGRWLAARFPEWSWAVSVAPSAQWEELTERLQTGPTSERRSALAQARRNDPDRGRQILEAVLPNEKAEVRAELLGQLKAEIGPADEPLLEAALDDRSKLVRAVAASLLEFIPSSRRSARMVERLAPLVQTEGRLNRKIIVDIPGLLDDGAERDGLAPRVATRVSKIDRFQRIIAAVPLGWWSTHLGWDAKTIVSRITEHDVIIGLVEAATNQRDPEWSLALFAATGRGELLAAFDRETAERLTLAQLTKGNGVLPVSALIHSPTPWSPELSNGVLDVLIANDFEPKKTNPVVTRLGLALHSSVIGRIAELLANHEREQLLSNLHNTLTLRQSIEAELPPSSPAENRMNR